MAGTRLQGLIEETTSYFDEKGIEEEQSNIELLRDLIRNLKSLQKAQAQDANKLLSEIDALLDKNPAPVNKIPEEGSFAALISRLKAELGEIKKELQQQDIESSQVQLDAPNTNIEGAGKGSLETDQKSDKLLDDLLDDLQELGEERERERMQEQGLAKSSGQDLESIKRGILFQNFLKFAELKAAVVHLVESSEEGSAAKLRAKELKNIISALDDKLNATHPDSVVYMYTAEEVYRAFLSEILNEKSNNERLLDPSDKRLGEITSLIADTESFARKLIEEMEKVTANANTQEAGASDKKEVKPSPGLEPENQEEAKAQARAQATARALELERQARDKAKAKTQAKNKALELEKQARAQAKAKAQAQAEGKAQAEAQSQAEARAQAEAKIKAQARAQALATQAEMARVKAELNKLKMEAAEAAQKEAQARDELFSPRTGNEELEKAERKLRKDINRLKGVIHRCERAMVALQKQRASQGLSVDKDQELLNRLNKFNELLKQLNDVEDILVNPSWKTFSATAKIQTINEALIHVERNVAVLLSYFPQEIQENRLYNLMVKTQIMIDILQKLEKREPKPEGIEEITKGYRALLVKVNEAEVLMEQPLTQNFTESHKTERLNGLLEAAETEATRLFDSLPKDYKVKIGLEAKEKENQANKGQGGRNVEAIQAEIRAGRLKVAKGTDEEGGKAVPKPVGSTEIVSNEVVVGDKGDPTERPEVHNLAMKRINQDTRLQRNLLAGMGKLLVDLREDCGQINTLQVAEEKRLLAVIRLLNSKMLHNNRLANVVKLMKANNDLALFYIKKGDLKSAEDSAKAVVALQAASGEEQSKATRLEKAAMLIEIAHGRNILSGIPPEGDSVSEAMASSIRARLPADVVVQLNKEAVDENQSIAIARDFQELNINPQMTRLLESARRVLHIFEVENAFARSESLFHDLAEGLKMVLDPRYSPQQRLIILEACCVQANELMIKNAEKLNSPEYAELKNACELVNDEIYKLQIYFFKLSDPNNFKNYEEQIKAAKQAPPQVVVVEESAKDVEKKRFRDEIARAQEGSFVDILEINGDLLERLQNYYHEHDMALTLKVSPEGIRHKYLLMVTETVYALSHSKTPEFEENLRDLNSILQAALADNAVRKHLHMDRVRSEPTRIYSQFAELATRVDAAMRLRGMSEVSQPDTQRKVRENLMAPHGELVKYVRDHEASSGKGGLKGRQYNLVQKISDLVADLDNSISTGDYGSQVRIAADLKVLLASPDIDKHLNVIKGVVGRATTIRGLLNQDFIAAISRVQDNAAFEIAQRLKGETRLMGVDASQPQPAIAQQAGQPLAEAEKKVEFKRPPGPTGRKAPTRRKVAHPSDVADDIPPPPPSLNVSRNLDVSKNLPNAADVRPDSSSVHVAPPSSTESVGTQPPSPPPAQPDDIADNWASAHAIRSEIEALASEIPPVAPPAVLSSPAVVAPTQEKQSGPTYTYEVEAIEGAPRTIRLPFQRLLQEKKISDQQKLENRNELRAHRIPAVFGEMNPEQKLIYLRFEQALMNKEKLEPDNWISQLIREIQQQLPAPVVKQSVDSKERGGLSGLLGKFFNRSKHVEGGSDATKDRKSVGPDSRNQKH